MQIVKEEIQSAVEEVNARFEALGTRTDALSTEMKDSEKAQEFWQSRNFVENQSRGLNLSFESGLMV